MRGRWVIGDAAPENTHTDAAVLVRDGLVEAVGPWRELRAAWPAADVIGSDAYAVLPGFVNAHHHSHGASNVQHGIADRLLEPWIASLAAMRPGDRYLETLLSGAALLRGGVTSVVDVVSAGGSADSFAGAVRASLDAYDKVGLRARVAPGYSSRSALVHDEDAPFLASLPPAVRAHAEHLAARRVSGSLNEDEYFAVMHDLHATVAAHPRVSLWFGPPGPQWVTDTLLERAAELAEAWGAGVQTHVNESFYEKLHGERAYGRPTVLHLAELGVLGPRFSIAHGVWLTAPEIDALAQGCAAVSHNPSSNLRLRCGIAPLVPMLDAGVTVALGMDGNTLGDDADMFAELRLAARLHRSPQLGCGTTELGDGFRLATEGGAALLGRAGELGRIAPGYTADLVLVCLDRVMWPWIAPECGPLELILARARDSDVAMVLVGGEVMLRDGVPTRFDVAAVARELAERLHAQDVAPRTDAAIRAVLPYLERWYGAWPVPELSPWTVANSRR